jgi:hypothetical protein
MYSINLEEGDRLSVLEECTTIKINRLMRKLEVDS